MGTVDKLLQGEGTVFFCIVDPLILVYAIITMYCS